MGSIIDNYSKHRVYGIPLQELLAREKQADGIPIILKNMFGWIAKNSCDVEGIFRVPGDSSIIEEWRKKSIFPCVLPMMLLAFVSCIYANYPSHLSLMSYTKLSST